MKNIPEEFLEYFQDSKKIDDTIRTTEQLKINKNPTDFTELKNKSINLFDEHGNIAFSHDDSDEEISIKANDNDTITINKRALNFIYQSDENKKIPMATLVILDAVKAVIHNDIFAEETSKLDKNDDVFFENSVLLNRKIEENLKLFLENTDWSEFEYNSQKGTLTIPEETMNNSFKIISNITSDFENLNQKPTNKNKGLINKVNIFKELKEKSKIKDYLFLSNESHESINKLNNTIKLTEENLIDQIKQEHSKIWGELADLNQKLNEDELSMEDLKQKPQKINEMINNLINLINDLDNQSDELTLLKKSLEEQVTDFLGKLFIEIADKVTLSPETDTPRLSQSHHGFFVNATQGSSSSSSDCLNEPSVGVQPN